MKPKHPHWYQQMKCENGWYRITIPFYVRWWWAIRNLWDKLLGREVGY
jgi:hypothetical protein